MTDPSLPAPRVGCGALITDDNGHVLLVLRRRAPEADCWGFPGGKVDFGETTEAAVRREVKEELGVEIALGGLAHLVNYIDPGAGQHWVAPVYRATITDGSPELREPDALAALEWFDPARLPDRLTEATRQTFAKPHPGG